MDSALWDFTASLLRCGQISLYRFKDLTVEINNNKVNLQFHTHHFLFLLSCKKKNKKKKQKGNNTWLHGEPIINLINQHYKDANAEQIKWFISVYVNVCKYSPDQPAELGFGLNVPDTISPRLDEEFPLDLLLQWHIKQKVFSEWCFKRLLVKTVFLLLFVVHGVKSLGTKLRKAEMENSALARTHAPLWAWHLHASSPPIHQLPGSSLVHLFKVNPFLVGVYVSGASAACCWSDLLQPGPPRWLTRGSVLSSVPAGVGCFPASVDSGWSRCRSLLSPDGRSTSHCWTSTDCERHE